MLNRVPDTDLPELPSYDPVESPVTLAELRAEGFEPIGGLEPWLAKKGIDVIADDIGRRAIAREDARHLFAERAAAEARKREQAERRHAELAKRQRPVVKGVPASEIPEGMSPAAFLTSQDPDRQRPSVHQQLLEEELAEGRRLADKLRGRP